LVVVQPSVRVEHSVGGDFLVRFSYRADIIHNAYLYLPVAKGDGHEDWLQIQRRVVTDPEWCGRDVSLYVCDHKEVHEGVFFKGDNYSGKLAVIHEKRYCKDPQCPVCALDGWLGDNARAALGKINAAIAKGYSNVEHFQVSYSNEMVNEYESRFGHWRAFEMLRKKAIEGLRARGWLGAVTIVHSRRIDAIHRNLKFGLHLHGLGFLAGGFDVCRNCEVYQNNRCASGCGDCKGYEARTRREKVKDGLIVKIFGKRSSGSTEEESVVKTLRYVLSHASYQKSAFKRFYIMSYWGCLANKRLKAFKVRAVHNCPVCLSVGVKNVMVRSHHYGSDFIVRDMGDLRYKKCFPSDEFDSDGLPNFVEAGGGGLDG
jgi:hypothetical protein